MVVAIKLTADSSTKIWRSELLNEAPVFNWWDVWMVDSRVNNSECSPSVCQMPEMAKNNNKGAKTHPKYK